MFTNVQGEYLIENYYIGHAKRNFEPFQVRFWEYLDDNGNVAVVNFGSSNSLLLPL